MSRLQVLSLGVGDAFSARHYSSCFAVEAGDRRLLIDCPHPIRKILREATAGAAAAVDVDRVDGIILTHLHADHASGLEGIGFYGRFVLNRRFPLIAHPDVVTELWPRNLAASMEWSRQEGGAPPARRTLGEFFDVVPLTEAAPVTFGPFTIACRPTVHNIPTFAVRITAGGRTLGYSADTAFDPDLIAWLEDADLVIHEASGGFLHTPYERLAALPEPLRRKMRLIHYPDRFDVQASAIEPLRQGQVYPV